MDLYAILIGREKWNDFVWKGTLRLPKAAVIMSPLGFSLLTKIIYAGLMVIGFEQYAFLAGCGEAWGHALCVNYTGYDGSGEIFDTQTAETERIEEYVIHSFVASLETAFMGTLMKWMAEHPDKAMSKFSKVADAKGMSISTEWSLVLSRERSEWLTALASDSLSQT